MIESLGDDKNDAVNWAQDRFGLLRHVAEELVVNSIKTGKIIITENGVFLTEKEEEFDEKAKNSSRHMMKRRTFAKDHNRIKRMANKMSSNNNGDAAANDMLKMSDDDEEDAK